VPIHKAIAISVGLGQYSALHSMPWPTAKAQKTVEVWTTVTVAYRKNTSRCNT